MLDCCQNSKFCFSFAPSHRPPAARSKIIPFAYIYIVIALVVRFLFLFLTNIIHLSIRSTKQLTLTVHQSFIHPSLPSSVIAHPHAPTVWQIDLALRKRKIYLWHIKIGKSEKKKTTIHWMTGIPVKHVTKKKWNPMELQLAPTIGNARNRRYIFF